MAIDPRAVGAILLLGIAPLVMGVFFYGFVPIDHRYIAAGRRRLLANDFSRWPFRSALPGALPFGLGVLIGLLGHALAGQTISLARFPADPAQDLQLAGVTSIFVGMWFMVWPPRQVLPMWYRVAADQRKTMPGTAIIAVMNVKSDLDLLGAEIATTMTRAVAERQGRAPTGKTAIDAAREVAARIQLLAGRINDPEPFRLVAEWKSKFDSISVGEGAVLATALASAPDKGWQILTSAADAALVHLKRISDSMAVDLPQL